MIKKVGLLIVALSLFGCNYAISQQQAGQYPSNYRDVIKAYMNNTYYDPYSLRDVSISAPEPRNVVGYKGWVVCVQANAKNRLGGYTGLETTAYMLSQGAVADTFTGQDICDKVSLTPWPEMTAGGQNK